MLCEILAERYAVLEAKNGQEALEILRTGSGEISLILLDIVMPVMDGYTFLDIVKADPVLSLIPVIVMTQSDSENAEITALSHGATDFLLKPYRPQIILHRIASIIHLRETAAIVNQLQYDRLTGLYTREYFYQRVREVLQENPDREYSIVSSNIENFKLYNDVFGTAAGDQLLRMLADGLRRRVGENAVCGRYSADRFVFLQERHEERENRQRLMEIQQSRHLYRVKNAVMRWGIYEIYDRNLAVEHMCDRALLAADSIKGQYNEIFAVYDDTLRHKLLRERMITDTMEAALAENQFVVYFQPKYSLRGNVLAGAEALVRWNHPQLGFITPGEFIPLFEKSGFITRLDHYVWDRVCAQLKDWHEKGYDALPVSVNVSRADIFQIDLPDILLQTVEKYGVAPAQLHLEITESAYTEDPDQIIQTVNQLRELGFVIELDDFGSGYSSLNMIGRMNLDVLKLDMKFIQSETAMQSEQGILRFVVELANRMNLRVVAEGVETKEQLERLREIGCDYAQGYFFAEPMSSYEFEMLSQNRAKARADDLPSLTETTEKLLIVEEDPWSRELIRRAFAEQYTLLETDSAEHALAYLADPAQSIAAVILSATLPSHVSLDLLDTIRRDSKTQKLPVLVTMPPQPKLTEQVMKWDVDDVAYRPRDPLCVLCLRERLDRMRMRAPHTNVEPD